MASGGANGGTEGGKTGQITQRLTLRCDTKQIIEMRLSNYKSRSIRRHAYHPDLITLGKNDRLNLLRIIGSASRCPPNASSGAN